MFVGTCYGSSRKAIHLTRREGTHQEPSLLVATGQCCWPCSWSILFVRWAQRGEECPVAGYGQGLQSLWGGFQARLEKECMGSSFILLCLQHIPRGMGAGGKGVFKISTQVHHGSVTPNSSLCCEKRILLSFAGILWLSNLPHIGAVKIQEAYMSLIFYILVVVRVAFSVSMSFLIFLSSAICSSLLVFLWNLELNEEEKNCR